MNFTNNKTIIIAFIFIIVGVIMIITSFFITEPLQCSAPTLSTIFTSSFVVFGIGMLLLMMGIILFEVYYRTRK
jgi:hypothetical protein